jgi:hypothetical protein
MRMASSMVVRPLDHQAHGIAAQGVAGHLLTADLHELVGIAAIHRLDQRIVHFEYFVDGLTPLVAGIGAMAAAGATAEFDAVHLVAEFGLEPQVFVRIRHTRCGAVFAGDPHQALGEDHLDRHGDHVARHAHVEQADRRRQRVVGVQA